MLFECLGALVSVGELVSVDRMGAVEPRECVLLTTGRRLALGQQTPTGMGLAAYGADRSLRFRLFQGASSWVVRAIGGRAYVESGIGQESVAVVDLGSGAVLDQRRGPLPTPLLDDAPVG